MGTLYVGIATTDEADNATLRLQRLLGSVAVVVAENVNRTEGLLDRLGLTEPPVVPVHDADLPDALEKADVALLLDGWHLGPTSSGHDLVRSAIARGLPVVPVPGSSLPILALVASGLPSASFVYLGELPPEPADRQRLVEAIAGEARTLVFIANPAQLADLVPALGERPLVEASSSTRGASIERWPSLALAVGSLAGRTAQDQRVWLVGGLQEPAMTWTEERLRAEVGARVRSGFTAREIGPMLSLESGWPRRVIYRLAVEASRQPDGEQSVSVPGSLSGNRIGVTMPEQKTDHDPQPLQLTVLPKEKVWGGHRLSRILGGVTPVGPRIGEAWIVWDQLTVASGPSSGTKLADLVRTYPRALLGTRLAEREPPIFPLLVKFLDTAETLSVQVHPDDGYAVRHEGLPNGKAEMWLILEADPGTHLIHGVCRPLSRPEAEAAIQAGTLQDSLEYIDVVPGDVILNPPGTIHALGGGILLYELQQSSDLTYRLYDWDRNDPARPLHLRKALDVASLEPVSVHKIRPVEVREAGARRQILCACDAFAVELLRVSSRVIERPGGTSLHVLTTLQGEGSLRYGAGLAREVSLSPGDTIVIPAALGEYEIKSRGGDQVVVKGYVPDLLADVIVPLRERGIPDSSILGLGGDPANSDLSRYLGRVE